MSLMHYPSPAARTVQFWLLVVLSAVIVYTAPTVWDFTPDSGVYVGTAANLLEQGRYWFNGHPNLLYYPGTSLFIALPISIFGLEFHILNIFFSTFAVAILWLTRSYFSVEEYGWAGLFAPLFLAANNLFQVYSHLLLSDMLFLMLVLLALVLWKKFLASGQERWYVACAGVVALAPMVRFHGLFLVAAFGLAVIYYLFRNRQAGWGTASRLLFIAVITLIPFVLWTVRNYVLHTEETFNMANRYFFGLQGLRLYGPGFGSVDWIDEAWKYPFYQIVYLFGNFGQTFLGVLRGNIHVIFVAGSVVGLIALGTRGWLRRSTVLEAVFVILAIGMLVQQFVGKESLYIVIRYWLPLLPFFIVVAAIGIGVFIRWFSRINAGGVAQSLVGVCVFVLLGSGMYGWIERLSPAWSEGIEGRFELAEKVAEFVESNVPEKAVILSTEWGVTPMLANRISYKLLESTCDSPSLERALEKGAEYFVILPVGAVDKAMELIERYPDLFRYLYGAKYVGNGEREIVGGIYKIERERLGLVLKGLECEV